MRDRMAPDDFNQWLAFRQLCPDKMERLIEICKHGFAILANAWGAKIEPNDLDPQKCERQEHEMTPEQAAMMAAMTMGTLKRN